MCKDHIGTEVVVMKEGPHYAKVVCSECHTFIKWLPKPETLERLKANVWKIDGLSGIKTLSAWERQFIGSLSMHPNKLSPKQQEILDKIAAEHLPPQ